MQCPEERQLKQYLRGVLGAEELAAASEHICSCADCRARLSQVSDYGKAAWLLGQTAMAVAECPDYEELSAFVDGNLLHEAHQAVEQHTAVCELCWSDVETIQAVRSRALLAPPVVARPGQFRRERSWSWLGWRRITAVGAAAAAAVALYIVYSNPPSKPTGPNTVAIAPDVGERPVKKPTAVTPNDIALPRDHETRPVRPQRIRIPEPKYVVALRDGGVAVRESGGRLSVNLSERELDALVEKKLRDGSVPPSFRLALNRDMLRGPSDIIEIGKLSPAPYGLAGPRPVFRWEPVDGASKYRVEVYRLDGTPVMDAETESTSYQPETRLIPAYYKWVVRVRMAALAEWKWSKAEVFRILSHKEKSLISLAKSKHPGSHLVLGTVYERVGLTSEATREFQSLVDDNPRSDLATRLLRGVQTEPQD